MFKRFSGSTPDQLSDKQASTGPSPDCVPDRLLVISGGSSAELGPIGSKLSGIGLKIENVALPEVSKRLSTARAVLATFNGTTELTNLFNSITAERLSRNNGLPVLVLVVPTEMLTELGVWLFARAASGSVDGLRLIVGNNFSEIAADLQTKLEPVYGPGVIAMPSAAEVENSSVNYFFAMSPEMQKTARMIGELAENNIERIYLLGGPGAGKTSLAYYYWLKRGKGRFITVNLSAESTGDKEAMKSLLCGHVTGAFPGASSREGAFSYADSGVTFIDESHGATGTVMQVLMEALDGGQYLPFGATKKRQLSCAVIFASNRSWEQLRSEINLDEHARLGATIVPVVDLAFRREDLAVGCAIALAKFSAKCRSWKAPGGLTQEGWQAICQCPWRGNMRTLFRVMETALVSQALKREESLLDAESIQGGIELWEPDEHHSHKIYTSYSTI